MASHMRQVLGEKDINAPLAATSSANKRWAANKLTSKSSDTPHSKPTTWSSEEARVRRSESPSRRSPIDSRKRVHEDSSITSTDQELISKRLKTTMPARRGGLATPEVLQDAPITRDSLEDTLPTEQTQYQEQDNAFDKPKVLTNTTPRRLASPFPEDGFTSVANSQPEPLTADRIAAMQPAQSNVRSFSASPTIVDNAPPPSAAELLRARLRFAMCKLRTDQTNASVPKLDMSTPVAPSKPRLIIKDPPERIMREFCRKTGRPMSYVAGFKRDEATVPRYVEQHNPVAVREKHGMPEHAGPHQYSSLPTMLRRNLDEEALRSTEHAQACTALLAIDCDSCSEAEEDERGQECLQPTVASISNYNKHLTSNAIKDRAADSLLRLGVNR